MQQRRRLFHRRLITAVLVSIMTSLLLSSNFLTVSAQTDPLPPADEVGCILTDSMLGGQGSYALTGLGSYALTGLGGAYALTGLGSYALTGLGSYALTGLGDLTEEEIAALVEEIENNTVGPDWLVNLINQIGMTEHTGFNSVRVALLVIDDFPEVTTPEQFEHGELVENVPDQILQAFSELGISFQVETVRVDISDENGYRVDLVAQAVEDTINSLRRSDANPNGFDHFVNNFSIGLIVPCEDAETGFSFADFIDQREEAIAALTAPSSVSPVLECYVDDGEGMVTAYFGYNNENDDPVEIPLGDNNNFNWELEAQPVTTFYPGRIINAFSATFYYEGEFETGPVWTLEGPDGSRRTSTVGSDSPRCNRNRIPQGEVTPILECVSVIDDVRVARYGYLNQTQESIAIEIGRNNRFRPDDDRGQVTVFEPGRVFDAFTVELSDDEDINWQVRSATRTIPTGSTEEAELCTDIIGGPEFSDFNFGDYLEDNGISLADLVDNLDEDEYKDFEEMLCGYAEETIESQMNGGDFRVINVVSSGNYAVELGPDPLYPATSPCTIATGSTLGDGEPPEQWVDSQDANIIVPGTWWGFDLIPDFPFVGSGTSYAAPVLSTLISIYLTFPDACEFTYASDGVTPLPPLNYDVAGDFVNATFDGSTYPTDWPLNCFTGVEPETTSLTIAKETTPDGATRNFRFEVMRDGDEGATANFRIGDGESETLEAIQPGTYVIRETNLPENRNWLLGSVECNVGESLAEYSFNAEAGEAYVYIAEGDDVTCTFNNERSGRITIIKFNDLNLNGTRQGARGEDYLDEWQFTLSQGETELASGQTGSAGLGRLRFSGLRAGEYTVCETPQEGWISTTLDENNCATVEVGIGSNTTLRVGNAREPGTIRIVKNALGGDGHFRFDLTNESGFAASASIDTNETSTTEISVAAGSYTLTERDRNGWLLEDLSCNIDGGEGESGIIISEDGTTAYIDLASNETVECTFTNGRTARIITTKFYDINQNGRYNPTQGENRLSGWTMTIYNESGMVVSGLTDDRGVVRFPNLPAGDYTVCEENRSGWRNSTGQLLDLGLNGYCVDVSVARSETTRVNFGNYETEPEVALTCTTDYASGVISESTRQGKTNGGGTVDANRSEPGDALGAPQNNDSLNFYALGFGGTLVVEFNGYILPNPNGADISITETSFGGVSFSQYPEAAIVYAAQTYEQLSDPNSWVRLSPDAQLDENLFFPASLEWARYIIVRDITNGESFNNNADGYDVDGIGACVIASEPPYTPPQEETPTTEETPVETPPPATTEEEEEIPSFQ